MQVQPLYIDQVVGFCNGLFVYQGTSLFSGVLQVPVSKRVEVVLHVEKEAKFGVQKWTVAKIYAIDASVLEMERILKKLAQLSKGYSMFYFNFFSALEWRHIVLQRQKSVYGQGESSIKLVGMAFFLVLSIS